MVGHLRAKVDLDQDVYSLAKARMEHIYDTFDEVCLMFSGGKDSTAVLHVALDVAHSHPRFARHLPLRTVFYDEEAIPYETEEYVRRVSQRDDVQLEWYCLPFLHRNACSRTSPNWWPWAPEDQERWCRPLPPEAITAVPWFPVWPPDVRMSEPDVNGFMANGQGNCAILMGIRAQESITRTRAVLRRPIDNYIVPFAGPTQRGNVWKTYPIYDWRTEDVWTAPKILGWDYNRAYDRLEMAGVPASQQRCSPAFGEEPLQKLHTYATCFPEVWSRMVERVPGVGAAVRYCRTDLYAYGSRPPKPAGMTWPDYIEHYVRKFAPVDQKRVAKRIREEINMHYRKVLHPIPMDAIHPGTGMSWNFLLMLAMRGDFKGRKFASTRIDKYRARDQWANYADELAQHLADGTWRDLAYPHPFPADPYALIPEEHREQP